MENLSQFNRNRRKLTAEDAEERIIEILCLSRLPLNSLSLFFLLRFPFFPSAFLRVLCGEFFFFYFLITFPASCTARTILSYPVQRQRLPDRSKRISCSLGFGCLSNKALAATRKPGVQTPHCRAAPSKKH